MTRFASWGSPAPARPIASAGGDLRFEKARLLNPDRNGWYVVPVLAVSVFIFAYAGNFGQAPILVYYALWLPLLAIDPNRVLARPVALAIVLAFPLFACLSFFWSDAPAVTARASIQLLSHAVCAFIAASLTSVRNFSVGMLAGTAVVVAYSLVFGQYHLDPLDGSISFVGAFASKNQLGLFSSLSILFSVLCLLALCTGKTVKLVALACAAMSAYALHLSQSASSVLALAATLSALGACRFIQMLPVRLRTLTISASAVLILFAALVAIQAGLPDTVLGAFGKDATLTGRTYLWAQGLAATDRAPAVGVGYQAYWVQGFSEAERLWKEFFIGTRSGFHFHNTAIETLVELGFIGLALLALQFLYGLSRAVTLVVSASSREGLVLFGISFMFLARSFVEVDVLQPYSIGSFLLFTTAAITPQSRRQVWYGTLPTGR